MGLSARGDLVLRFRGEIAGVMALVQLFFRLPAGVVDHAPALGAAIKTGLARSGKVTRQGNIKPE
jgi:hypothetical protein